MATFYDIDNTHSFKDKEHKYSHELEMAIAEAEAIVKNDDAPVYDNMDDLRKALLS